MNPYEDLVKSFNSGTWIKDLSNILESLDARLVEVEKTLESVKQKPHEMGPE